MSVCLSVCLFVRSIKSKTNDLKVFKLGIGYYTRSNMFSGFEWSKVKVNNTTVHNDTLFKTLITLHPHSLGGDTDKSNTAWVRTL